MMSMRGSRHSKNKVALIIALLAAIGFLFGGHLFSFISPIPAFPVTYISPSYSNATHTGYYSGGYMFVSDSEVQEAYIYNITYCFPMENAVIIYPYGPGDGGGLCFPNSVNFVLPASYSNHTDINYSLENNNATISYLYNHAYSAAQVDSCGNKNITNINAELNCMQNAINEGYNAAPQMDAIYHFEQLISLEQETNQYIISNENFITTTTSTSTSTTTINANYSISPPTNKLNFNFFNKISSSISEFVQNILGSISKSFGISGKLV
jgi:hypothetical protein